MLVDAVLTIVIAIVNVLLIPLVPLFSWIPAADSVLQDVPDMILGFMSYGSAILYYLNLGPFLNLAMIFIGGVVGVRLMLVILDIVLPPIPFVGKVYEGISHFLRGL